MDIDKMIADYTDSLMSQAKKWQSMGYSAEINEATEEVSVAVTSKEPETATEEIFEEETAEETSEETLEASSAENERGQEEKMWGEFHARVFSGAYPLVGARVTLKSDGELIYALTTGDGGCTEKVSLSYYEPYSYSADVSADGFEGRRDIPVTFEGEEAALQVQLTPVSNEEV